MQQQEKQLITDTLTHQKAFEEIAVKYRRKTENAVCTARHLAQLAMLPKQKV